MPTRTMLRPTLLALATLALLPNIAHAQNFPGLFTRDDETRLFRFEATTAPVSLFTNSSANGGFDPFLSLFDNTGFLIATNDDQSADNPDSLISFDLAPGTYFLTLSQYENQPVGPNLTNGFLYTGVADYTNQFALPGGGTAPFLNFQGEKRTGAYNVVFSGVVGGAAEVPEPGAVALAVGTLFAVGGTLLRRRKSSN